FKLSYFSRGRAVRMTRNAQGPVRQAHSTCRRGPGRPIRACATGCPRTGDLPARAANAGGSGRAAEGRDREVVADHQGGEHQGGMSAVVVFRFAKSASSIRKRANTCGEVKPSACEAVDSCRLTHIG